MKYLISIRKFAALLAFTAILTGLSVPAFGQSTRQVLYPKGPVRERPRYCNGGWSGVVTYTKTLNDSQHTDDPIAGRLPPEKNRLKIDRTRDLKYVGKAVIDGTDPAKSVVNTLVSFKDDDKNRGIQKEFDSCRAFNDEHFFIVDTTDDRLTEAVAEGPAESFQLRVNEQLGTYSFNLGFPQAKGKYHRIETQKRSGFCGPRTNEGYDKKTDREHIEPAQSFTIENRKVDPAQPDLLTGTYTWGDDGKGTVRTFVYTVTWYFTRCPGKLLITDIKFEHPKFPDWDNWKEFDPYYDGTKDGNRVRITAKVLNFSSETKFADVKITEDEEPPAPGYQKPPDIPIPNGEASIKIDPGEEREVQVIWDTEGQSWKDTGQPNSSHFIKAEAFENGQKVSAKMELLRISPKPLVMVHGLWSSPEAFGSYQNMLTGENGDWRAYAVGEKPQYGKLSTGGAFMSADKTMSVFQNADEVAKYVRYVQEDANAWHIDMVGHDLGGLIARAYIHKLMPDLPDRRPLVKHLMMLGTPNNGAPCADQLGLKFTLYGEHVQALNDLQPDRVAVFNQYVTNRKGVKFSALAGNSVPLTCGGYMWNDGFVPVDSAIYGIEDHAYSNDFHDKLTNDRNAGMFVLPHVITGPKGTYPVPVRSDPNDINRWNGNKDHWIYKEDYGWGSYNPQDIIPMLFAKPGGELTAQYRRGGGPSDFNADDSSNEFLADETPTRVSREIKLSPGQIAMLEVPLRSGASVGFSFLADAKVSATLMDDKGVVRDTNLAGSPESGLLFRPLFTARPVQEGTWKIKLENGSPNEAIVLVAEWARTDGAALVIRAEKPNAAGVVPLKAMLRNTGTANPELRVKARIYGVEGEIELLDDGAHGDGKAGDGVFGAVTGKLLAGNYTVEAYAEGTNIIGTAATSFSVGNDSKESVKQSPVMPKTPTAPKTAKPRKQ